MIISRTPLRISFVGGGTDFAGFYKKTSGAVVSLAINKYVYVFINKKFDGHIRVSYSITEYVKNVNEIQHNIIRESLKLAGIEKGIDISYMGDIQVGKEGTGLGSSSSLAVGVLNALYAYLGKKVSKELLAKQACQVEVERLKRPIGKQDQYAAAFGGLNFIKFNQDESVDVVPIDTLQKRKKELEKNLLLLNTRLTRLGEKILEDQKRKIDKNIKILIKMANLSLEMKKILQTSGSLDGFGELLHENWILKRKLANGISNPQVEKWYSVARKFGAVGGKICGAGGGGFLLLYAPFSKHKKILSELPELTPLKFSFSDSGSKIIYKD